MTAFADTSALFAVLDRDDDNHGAAAAAFGGLIEEGLVTHNYVIVESAALAQSRLGADAVRALIQDVVPAIRTLWINEDVHRAAVAAFIAASRRKISLVDWVSFEVMRREGIERAFAFDRDFVSQGYRTVPR